MILLSNILLIKSKKNKGTSYKISNSLQLRDLVCHERKKSKIWNFYLSLCRSTIAKLSLWTSATISLFQTLTVTLIPLTLNICTNFQKDLVSRIWKNIFSPVSCKKCRPLFLEVQLLVTKKFQGVCLKFCTTCRPRETVISKKVYKTVQLTKYMFDWMTLKTKCPQMQKNWLKLKPGPAKKQLQSCA